MGNRGGRAEVAAWFWAAPKPVLFPLCQAALLNRESFVVLANYISFVGALMLIVCTVFQLKHHCVKNPSDLCTINVSGLKFSKVRPASRGVIGVSQTWGSSWLLDHCTSRVLGDWESGHREGEGQTGTHWVGTTFTDTIFCYIFGVAIIPCEVS